MIKKSVYKIPEGKLVKIELETVDNEINEYEPWKKNGLDLISHLKWYIRKIRDITYYLQPFLPETSEKILNQFSGEIKSSNPLFPRIE